MADSRDFDLAAYQVQESVGLDSFLERNADLVTPTASRRKVASLQDLAGFVRLSNDTLVHKADQDLWAIKRQSDGSMFVERMFDDKGSPLKV
jgi:hypothetical protein